MLDFIINNSGIIILICIPIIGILLNIIIYMLSSRRLANLYGSKISSIKQSIDEINSRVDFPELYDILHIVEKMYEDKKNYLKENTKDNFLYIILLSLLIIVPAIFSLAY